MGMEKRVYWDLLGSHAPFSFFCLVVGCALLRITLLETQPDLLLCGDLARCGHSLAWFVAEG